MIHGLPSGQDKMIDFEMNLQALFSTLYVGFGSNDVSDVICFLGLAGGKALSRSMNNYEEDIYDRIIKVANDVIDSGLRSEICETVSQKYSNMYSKSKITKLQNYFMMDYNGSAPSGIFPKLGLAVSYDMG